MKMIEITESICKDLKERRLKTVIDRYTMVFTCDKPRNLTGMLHEIPENVSELITVINDVSIGVDQFSSLFILIY